MDGNIPNKTQELRVLKVLQDAKGAWVSYQYILRTMMLSQGHRAIWNLQHRRDRYFYEGEIVASEFTDTHGFKSYALRETEMIKLEIPITKAAEEARMWMASKLNIIVSLPNTEATEETQRMKRP